MASPLRSWYQQRFGRPGSGGTRRRVASVVEPLEIRQLLTASLVSVDVTSTLGANNDSTDPDISSNGRYVVFTSAATDIVSEDTNTTTDVYLRDLQTGVTKLVSVSSAGNTPGNGNSSDASVSDDGRYVAFTSGASNLVAGDNNAHFDVFVRDMFTNTTTLVSVAGASVGTTPANGDSFQPAISDNGRFVAFSSDASNINSTDHNVFRDVFLRDLVGHTTTLISRTLAGDSGNGNSQNPGINSTGEFVVFDSDATNLTAAVPVNGTNVYEYDTGINFDILEPGELPPDATYTMKLISVGSTASTGGGVDINAGSPSVSDDGRYVAFVSTASDLVTGDVIGVADAFRKDATSGTVTLISQSTGGAFAGGASTRPKISADGNRVAFSTTATNLDGLDGGSGPDVYVRDVSRALTVLVSVNNTNNGGSGSSIEPAINDEGTLVAFSSQATNLSRESVSHRNIFVANVSLPPLFDTPPPTVRIPDPQPSTSRPAIGALVLPFTVIYDDNDGGTLDTSTLGNNDVVVTGPNGFTANATLATITSTTGPSVTAVYTVPAPGGSLSSEDNGVYTVSINAGQVADINRNFLQTPSSVQFTLNLPASETVLPAPTFFGGSPAVGSQTYEFTVFYSERGGINIDSFGNDDLVVTGPNGFSQNATYVSRARNSETTTSVVYRITAPGGTWDALDAGDYTVSVLPGGVTDVANNAVAAGAIGQFTALGPDLVAIPLRNLRSGAISGVDSQKARVRILNVGTSETTVPVAVTLYVSSDQTLDAGDATIGTFVEKRNIKADDFRTLPVRFTYPQVAEGNYYILSQVDSNNAVTEQREDNNVAASFHQVGLSTPFVDLVPTLIPFAGNRSRLGTNVATIKIRNAGNVTADADINVALTAVSDVTPTPGERPVANIPLHVTIAPGQTATYKLPFTFPIDFERGSFRLVATIDSTNVVPERDDVNNRVESLSSFNFA
jgi:hypothetical protein